MADTRTHARELAREAIARGDVTGWFDTLYRESERDGFRISWVDLAPNPYLVDWLAAHESAARTSAARTSAARTSAAHRSAAHGRALVVGCGYGDDAELLAQRGFDVVAFDVSPTAVARCRSRFPGSAVEYAVADVLAPPAEWTGAFDFVFEAYTVQVLHGAVRPTCARSIAATVAPGGILLAVARSRRAEDAEGLMPWPLTRAELDEFRAPGLALSELLEVVEPGDPPVPRFVAEFRRS